MGQYCVGECFLFMVYTTLLPAAQFVSGDLRDAGEKGIMVFGLYLVFNLKAKETISYLAVLISSRKTVQRSFLKMLLFKFSLKI